MSAVDAIRVIEKCYEVEQDERAWLDGVLTATRPLLDRGLGLVASLYDVSDVSRPSATIVDRFDVPDAYDEQTLREAFTSLSASCVRSLVVSTGYHLVRWEDRFRDAESSSLTSLPLVPSPFAPTDVVVVNAADPTGRGCFVSANVPCGSSLSTQTRTLWARLSAHMCAGLRLRRRLAAAKTSAIDGAEAILGIDGRIEHAGEQAESAVAREALTAAARVQLRVRGPLRREAPGKAVGEWKGMIAARWTLIEHFDHDGRRYLLAQCNDPLEGQSWIDTLTAREHQVVAYASLGHWSKLIAYELGIADSTVRVHLTRAAQKAGVRSTRALVDKFRRDRMNPR